ncbi:MAG: alpha/beta hydrolase [Planctomycetota bacterium]
MHKRGWKGRRGSVIWLEHDSRVLKGNPWGDPTRRMVGVYTSAGYDPCRLQPYPLLMALAGYFGSAPSHASFKVGSENIPERIDRLVHSGAMQDCVVVFADAFTSLGGNQYVNSQAVGRYEDWIIDEILPFVEAKFNAGGRKIYRGIFGKSSGGFGALHHGLSRPDVWGALACHSGDMGFDACYKPDLYLLADFLNAHKGDPVRAVRKYWDQNKPSQSDGMAMMMLGMAATYDARPGRSGKFNLPFSHLPRGEIDEKSWARWKRWDPLERVKTKKGQAALKSMALCFIDVGRRDQFRMLYGTRQMVHELNKRGIRHSYEEFDDNHSGIDYRLDLSLPKLVQALQGPQ